MFAEDFLHCPCGGHRSVTAFAVDERLARSLLTTLGLAAEPATFAPARAPPQVEFASAFRIAGGQDLTGFGTGTLDFREVH